MPVRFGLITLPATKQAVKADAVLATEAGFDLLATGDHIRHPRDPTVPLLDGWSVLAAWAEVGRDPRSLRRSLLAFRPLTPWRSSDSLDRLAEQARRLGFEEIILYKPANDDERRVFDIVVAERLPALKLL
jgi:hypothetical protein